MEQRVFVGRCRGRALSRGGADSANPPPEWRNPCRKQGRISRSGATGRILECMSCDRPDQQFTVAGEPAGAQWCSGGFFLSGHRSTVVECREHLCADACNRRQLRYLVVSRGPRRPDARSRSRARKEERTHHRRDPFRLVREETLRTVAAVIPGGRRGCFYWRSSWEITNLPPDRLAM